MKKTLTIVVVFLTATAPASHAQQLSPGYIVPAEGDTIKGYIVDLTDATLALGIDFKRQVDDHNVVRYSPRDLAGFGFDYGRRFQTVFVVSASDSMAVFAKAVLSGKVSVSSWRKEGEGEPEFFLINQYSNRRGHVHRTDRVVIRSDRETPLVANQTIYQGVISFVKGDSINSYPPAKQMKYGEKNIVQDILAYNQMFKEQFLVSQYRERENIGYHFSMGLPINSVEEIGYRMALFKHKTLPEKNRRVSMVQGISYRFWQRKKSFDTSVESYADFQNHYVSILPIGVNFQTDNGSVRPFFLVALGGFFSVDTNYSFEGRTTKLVLFPALNLAAGLKFKLNSNFGSFQITPSADGIFFNLGYGI